MSIVDKVIAAVTPPESEEQRLAARRTAQAAATPGDWLSQILDHHLDLEEAFENVRNTNSASARADALKQLGVLLTGHAIAEESVIYPALAEGGRKAHAGMGYDEQAMVKIQMALLEKLDPMSEEFLDKLEHIEGAVAHHMYAEEGNWFLDLKETAPAADQSLLTQRYAQEYQRYVGSDAPG
jgi:hypothetical protein